MCGPATRADDLAPRRRSGRAPRRARVRHALLVARCRAWPSSAGERRRIAGSGSWKSPVDGGRAARPARARACASRRSGRGSAPARRVGLGVGLRLGGAASGSLGLVRRRTGPGSARRRRGVGGRSPVAHDEVGVLGLRRRGIGSARVARSRGRGSARRCGAARASCRRRRCRSRARRRRSTRRSAAARRRGSRKTRGCGCRRCRRPCEAPV